MSCWFCASLSRVAEATLRILPRSGSTACEARSRACLAEPPAESPSTINSSEPCAEELVQSASLPGRRSLRIAVLRATSFSMRRRSALLGALDRPVEQFRRLARRGGEPMVEGVAHRALDDPRRLGGLQAALVLALEFRLADEHRDERGAAGHHVVGGQRAGALGLADALGVILQGAQQRGAQARLVRAAVGRRDRVAIGMDEAVLGGEPGDRPFDRAVLARLLDLAGEDLIDDERLALDVGGEIVLEAAGKVEDRLGRDFRASREQRRARSASGFRRRRTDRPWSASS